MNEHAEADRGSDTDAKGSCRGKNVKQVKKNFETIDKQSRSTRPQSDSSQTLVTDDYEGTRYTKQFRPDATAGPSTPSVPKRRPDSSRRERDPELVSDVLGNSGLKEEKRKEKSVSIDNNEHTQQLQRQRDEACEETERLSNQREECETSIQDLQDKIRELTRERNRLRNQGVEYGEIIEGFGDRSWGFERKPEESQRKRKTTR